MHRDIIESAKVGFLLKGQKTVSRQYRTRTKRSNQLPPHSFLDECIYVWQRFAIVKVGHSVRAYDRIYLFLRSPLDLWIQHHGEEECLAC